MHHGLTDVSFHMEEVVGEWLRQDETGLKREAI